MVDPCFSCDASPAKFYLFCNWLVMLGMFMRHFLVVRGLAEVVIIPRQFH